MEWPVAGRDLLIFWTLVSILISMITGGMLYVLHLFAPKANQESSAWKFLTDIDIYIFESLGTSCIHTSGHNMSVKYNEVSESELHLPVGPPLCPALYTPKNLLWCPSSLCWHFLCWLVNDERGQVTSQKGLSCLVDFRPAIRRRLLVKFHKNLIITKSSWAGINVIIVNAHRIWVHYHHFKPK